MVRIKNLVFSTPTILPSCYFFPRFSQLLRYILVGHWKVVEISILELHFYSPSHGDANAEIFQLSSVNSINANTR